MAKTENESAVHTKGFVPGLFREIQLLHLDLACTYRIITRADHYDSISCM